MTLKILLAGIETVLFKKYAKNILLANAYELELYGCASSNTSHPAVKVLDKEFEHILLKDVPSFIAHRNSKGIELIVIDAGPEPATKQRMPSYLLYSTPFITDTGCVDLSTIDELLVRSKTSALVLPTLHTVNMLEAIKNAIVYKNVPGARYSITG